MMARNVLVFVCVILAVATLGRAADISEQELAEFPDNEVSSLIRESADISNALERDNDSDLNDFPVSTSTSHSRLFHSRGSGGRVIRHHHKHFHGAGAKSRAHVAAAAAAGAGAAVVARNFQLRAYKAAEQHVEAKYPKNKRHHRHHRRHHKKGILHRGRFFTSHIEPAYGRSHRAGRRVHAHAHPILDHPLIEDDTKGGRFPSRAERRAHRLKKKCRHCKAADMARMAAGKTPLTRKLVDTVALLKSILDEKKMALAKDSKAEKLPGDDNQRARMLADRLDRLQEKLNAPKTGSMRQRLLREQTLLHKYNKLKKEIRGMFQNYALEHGKSVLPAAVAKAAHVQDSPQAIIDYYARSTRSFDDSNFLLPGETAAALLRKRLPWDLKRADENSPSKTLLSLKKDGSLTTKYDETGRAVVTLGDNDHPRADVRLHMVGQQPISADGTQKVGRGFAQRLIDNMVKYNKLRPMPAKKDAAHISQKRAGAAPSPAKATTRQGKADAKAAAKAADASAAVKAAAAPASPATPAAAAAKLLETSATPSIPSPPVSHLVMTQSAARPTLIEHEADVIIGAPAPESHLRVPFVMPLQPAH